MSVHVVSVADKTVEDDRLARKAAFSAFFGFFVDMFDVFLPIIVLAPASIYFQPPTTPPEVAALAASLIAASTLLGRPLGAILFGYLSDVIGRKPITMISVIGFGLCSILMGLLPGYASWGSASLYTLIGLRFVCGAFLGGEYTAANVLAMEAAPTGKRGFYSGAIQSGYPVAYICITLLTFLMLDWFPTGGLDSAYIAYGWRIPFFVGGLLALTFVVPFRAGVPESNLWQRTEKRENPFRVIFSAAHFPDFAQVFILLTGLWFLTITAAAAILPGILIRFVHLSSKQMTMAMMIASATLLPGYLLVGSISQKVGRRPVMWFMAVFGGAIGMISYYYLVAPVSQFWLIALLSALIVTSLTSVWGLVTCYLNERFSTQLRSSGFGMGFTLPVIIPSFYGFYQNLFAQWMPAQYTVLPLVAIGSLLTVIGALIGPETKDVDLRTAGSEAESMLTQHTAPARASSSAMADRSEMKNSSARGAPSR